MEILLVEPNFPIPNKSKNHSNFLPIGLLKIASYHRSIGDKIKLVRGCSPCEFNPDEIKITSLFTYWSKYVKQSVEYYRGLYPKAKIEVGGIYASLMPDHCKDYTGCDEVHCGLYRNGIAEKYNPAYDLVDVDYQIIHASRGCFRKCNFCGTWRLEPEVTYKESIKIEIKKTKIVFYDNNFIANPYIENILDEIAELRIDRKVIHCESQSGLDGRLLNLKLAYMLKRARFSHPRIAWDGKLLEKEKIKNSVDILVSAGYKYSEIYIFMIYNYNISYREMMAKLDECRKWGVQVIDCRYRPLNQTFDKYNPRVKAQDSLSYYIHPKWTDSQVRNFRKSVRRQNIAIRLNLPEGRYIEGIEKRFVPAK